jgi:hypothetical protein
MIMEMNMRTGMKGRKNMDIRMNISNMPVRPFPPSKGIESGRWVLIYVGKFSERDMPDYSGRDWTERAFTIGIGG